MLINNKKLVMNNKYRLVLFLFLAATGVSLLFYFLPGDFQWPDSKKSKIYFADNITRAHKKIIANFNAKYGDEIEIVPVDLPFSKFNTNERKELLARTLRNQNSRIDIFTVDQIWVSRFAKWAEPLSRYFSKQELKEILPQALNSCYYENILVGVPLHIDIGLMYYRRDLLSLYPEAVSLEQKLKQSISWDELFELTLIKKFPKPYYLFQGDNYEGLFVHTQEIVAGLGGELIHDGKIDLLNPVFIKGCQHLVDLIHKYKISPMQVTQFNEIASYHYAIIHDIPLFRGWPSLLKEINDFPEAKKIKGHLGVAALPNFNGHPSVSAFGGWNLMVSSNSTTTQILVNDSF